MFWKRYMLFKRNPNLSKKIKSAPELKSRMHSMWIEYIIIAENLLEVYDVGFAIDGDCGKVIAGAVAEVDAYLWFDRIFGYHYYYACLYVVAVG